MPPMTRLVIKLLALAFVRTNEFIQARRSEFDLETAHWNIPLERMKMRSPRIASLTQQAVEILRMLHTLTRGGACVLLETATQGINTRPMKCRIRRI
jgi:integrase